MDTTLLIWTMLTIVGTMGVIKNYIVSEKLGKKFWTTLTLIVGAGIAVVAMKLPIEVLQVWTAVTGATLFYDTIFKGFQKFIEKVSKNTSEN